MENKIKNVYWPSINTIGEAETALKSSVYMFYFAAGLLAIMGLILSGDGYALIEPSIVTGLSLWLQKTKARWLAITLLLWTVLVVFVTIMNKVTHSNQGGNNIFLSLMVLCGGITAVRAAWFINKKPEKPNSEMSNKVA